jgi:hypothetical protein
MNSAYRTIKKWEMHRNFEVGLHATYPYYFDTIDKLYLTTAAKTVQFSLTKVFNKGR